MEVSCIILAGGKSSRLGNKAFIILNNRPLIAYVLDVAKKIFSDIVIVVKNKRQKRNLESIGMQCAKIVEDNSRTFSPIAGIKEGLKHVKGEYVFVIACDMPFVKEKTIRELLSRIRKDVRCVFYAWSAKRFEPLCAIYKKDVFADSSPKDSLHSLIEKIDNKILIPISKKTKEFLNINTKKDLTSARKLIQSYSAKLRASRTGTTRSLSRAI